MRKLLVLPAVCALAACGTSDPLLGSWAGDTDPTKAATSYKIELKSNKTYEYTYVESIFAENPADAAAQAGCTVESHYSGTFTDNPYDTGGVLSLVTTAYEVHTSGCADPADNAEVTLTAMDADFDPPHNRYLYRVKGKTLEMCVYLDPDLAFVPYAKQ